MERYKNWEIELNDFGYYVAVNLNDCDAFMKFDKDLDLLKEEIDEEIELELEMKKYISC